MNKKKIFKVLGIVLAVIIVIAIIFIAILNKSLESVGIGGGEVADYENRVNIWNTVAGNSSKSKLDDMNIKKIK